MTDDEFGELLVQNMAYCRKIAWNFFRDNNDADEATQDALLTAWKNRSKFDHYTYTSVRPWLKSIVVSTCHTKVRHWSQEKRDKSKSAPMPDYDVHDVNYIPVHSQVEARLELEEVFWIVRTFPEWQARIFFLRWADGLEWREIADITGIPYERMPQKVQGIRQKIRRRLQSL